MAAGTGVRYCHGGIAGWFGWGRAHVVTEGLYFIVVSCLCFPYESRFISIGPSHGVGSSGRILVAFELALAVGTVVATRDTISVAPTVTDGVQGEDPSGMVEFWTGALLGGWFVVGIRFGFGCLLLFGLG
jgi:hypothetical protein